jgi:hypothetical protein
MTNGPSEVPSSKFQDPEKFQEPSSNPASLSDLKAGLNVFAKRLLYGLEVRSKLSATRMNAMRHESDECPAAGAIETGSFPNKSHGNLTMGAVRRSVQFRAFAVPTVHNERSKRKVS